MKRTRPGDFERSRMVMEAIMLTGLLSSCTCGENRQHVVVTSLDNAGVHVGVTITAVVSTDLVRSGLLTTHRYGFAIAYGERQTTYLYFHTREEIPSEEVIQRNAAALAFRVAPDGRRFALDLRPFGSIVHLFHLLPSGPPFCIEDLDDKLGLQDVSAIDWASLPPPEQIARAQLLAKSETGDYCLSGYLGNALKSNLESEEVADIVLDGWPRCQDTHFMVADHAAKISSPVAWKQRLRALAVAYIEQPTQTAVALRGIDMAARSLGDTELLARVYRAALVHWPDPEVHDWVYRDHIGELPTDVREALVARAQAILNKADSYDYQRDYAKEVLRAAGK